MRTLISLDARLGVRSLAPQLSRSRAEQLYVGFRKRQSWSSPNSQTLYTLTWAHAHALSKLLSPTYRLVK